MAFCGPGENLDGNFHAEFKVGNGQPDGLPAAFATGAAAFGLQASYLRPAFGGVEYGLAVIRFQGWPNG